MKLKMRKLRRRCQAYIVSDDNALKFRFHKHLIHLIFPNKCGLYPNHCLHNFNKNTQK